MQVSAQPSALLLQTRDGQALRTQLQQTYQSVLDTKFPYNNTQSEILNTWANSPTQCEQIVVEKFRHQILIPDNPTLSNTITQPDGLPPLKSSKIQQYTIQKEQIRIKILDHLSKHGDQITIAFYDDLSHDKSFSQERVSFLEAEFERLLKIEDIEPEVLVDETYNLINEMTNTYNNMKNTLNKRQDDMQTELKQTILLAVKDLEKTCLTEDQIEEHLHPVVITINQRLLRLSLQIRETLGSLECQTQMCSEDFISQAHRIIDSRKATSARRTYDQFKQYCYVDNDFPRSTRRALGNCNCSHQLMAARVNDWISSAETTRQSAFDLVQQFLETRSKALEDRKTFERRYHELEIQTQAEYDQAIERLKTLGLFDVYCDKMEYVLRDWKRRWEARLKFVRDYSTRLCHANSFYVACIILLIRLLERSKQRQAGLDLHLVNYFDRVISAIETRFQRDQDQYLSSIRKVDQAFTTIANATDAKLMSEIAKQLTEAMTVAVETRRQLLSKTADGHESLYIRCINDIALDALHFIVRGMCLTPESVNWQQRKLEGLSQVKGQTLLLDEINKIIFEREQDDDEGDVEPVQTDLNSTKPEDVDAPKSRKPSAKAQAPPPPANKKGAKPVRELNEQGLYMDLPNFTTDIDLEEYGKTKCFSFNDDGVLMDELLEAMQGLLGDQGSGDKKKAPPKKGEELKQCAAVAQLEQGTEELKISSEKERLNITINMFKDNRAPLHYLLFDFMQQEGQRMAYNAAVDDFKQKVEDWKIEYMKILTEEQNNAYEEAIKNYQAAMKEHEKKIKTVKKGEEPPEPPVEPKKPDDVKLLPQDVQTKIDAVIIPEHKDWDRSNVYLHLLYELLSYDELKRIPNSEAQYGFQERAFLEAKLEDTKVETPKISAKPTKSAKKSDPKTEKRDDLAKNDEGGEELFSDSRFVKHGQGELLRSLMMDVFSAELKASNEKYDLMNKFYIQQGATLARKARIDQSNYRVLLQAHQQQYVQQAVIQVQALCAQRNGITQRNLETVARIINDIEIRYINDDSRFNNFSQTNIAHLFEPPVEERTPSAKGKAPAKGAPIVPANEQNMIQTLQRSKIEDFVSVKYSEKDKFVRQILLTDLFAQLHPTFRLYPDYYEKYFLQGLMPGFKQPHLMHRQIIYAGNSYEYQIRKRYNRDYNSILKASIATLRAELEKMRTQGISWGQEGAKYDFTFADKTICNLRGEYTVNPVINVPQDYAFEAQHPCVAIYEAKLSELIMLEEDLRSAYASDIHAFNDLITKLSEAVKAGNSDAIKNNDQRVGIQRETSRLAALIAGRVAGIVDQLPGIRSALEACDGLFAKQRPNEDKAVQKALSMASSMTRRPKEESKEMEYRRDLYQAQKVTAFAVAALRLENLYYLLGYERDIAAIWKKQSTTYVIAKDQYLQRQKAYNLYYTLLVSTIYALETLSEGFNPETIKQMIDQILTSVKPFADIKNLKPYQAKNKAYVDQSQIDIGTQMREEVTQLFTKFATLQLDLEHEIQESQCITEQDWFNFYVHEMGISLETTIADARRQIQELIQLRDTIITQASSNMCTYFTDYIQEQFAIATINACNQLSADKDEFLKKFNLRFDRLRPVLSEAPEKATELASDVEELYAAQMTSLEKNLAAGSGALQRLLWFQVSFQLIPELLFCLIPTTSQGTAVSLQLNALIQAAAASVPAIETASAPSEQKDTKQAKGKGKIEEEAPKQVSYEQPVDMTIFSDELIQGIQNDTDEDSVAYQLKFVLALINKCVIARCAIIGNYAELPTQPKAPEKGKVELPAHLNPVLSDGALEQIQDIEALPLARPLVGGGVEPSAKPPSAKGVKKGAEPVTDTAIMPSAPLYQLGQAKVQLLDDAALDQIKQISPNANFNGNQAAIVSIDKLGAGLAVTTAGRSFQFYFQALPAAANFLAQATTTRVIYEKVKGDLVGALQRFQK